MEIYDFAKHNIVVDKSTYNSKSYSINIVRNWMFLMIIHHYLLLHLKDIEDEIVKTYFDSD